MEKQVWIKNDYNSLEKVLEFLKKESAFQCSIEYDIWDIRTDRNGQMEKCIVVKKSGMNGAKMFFSGPSTVLMSHIVPNKIMNVYFGNDKKASQNILQLITGKIKDAFLSGSQRKAFDEIEQSLNKITV